MSLWYVLRAATRQERRACEALAELKIEHYLPMEVVPRVINRRELTVQRPLFPGYLFAKAADDDELIAACHADGVHAPVRYTLPSGDRAPLPIPAMIITDIRKMEEAGEFDRTRVPPPREPRTGDSMRITDGDFRGVIGAMLEVRGADRIAILINSKTIEVAKSDLEFAA